MGDHPSGTPPTLDRSWKTGFSMESACAMYRHLPVRFAILVRAWHASPTRLTATRRAAPPDAARYLRRTLLGDRIWVSISVISRRQGSKSSRSASICPMVWKSRISENLSTRQPHAGSIHHATTT
jgi:hypothetical protein